MKRRQNRAHGVSRGKVAGSRQAPKERKNSCGTDPDVLELFRKIVCRLVEKVFAMAAFFLWCILFVVCWPLALLALVLYPIVWILLLPFRIVGIAVHGVLELVWAVVTLPARLLTAPFRL